MKTFYIQTLGCKVNQYESDGISGNLEKQGWSKSDIKKGADVFIINTCAVTSKAGMQSRQAIRKIIRENPDAKVIVTGCHAQTDPDQINQIQDIDQIICHKDKIKIAQKITSIYEQNIDLTFTQADHSKANTFHSFENTVKGDMTRAYLKIQDGCDAFCTYCIVPYARGSSVSMPENEVFNHLTELNRSGFKEIIVTGIHTGMYGLDFKKKTSLTQLLEKINIKKPVHRLRLSSIESTEISNGLIQLAKPGNILCNHFHIPLQSGDDDILKKMKRPYTAALFEDIVLKIVDQIPNVGIGVDILVGFPSETDEQFENTFKLIEKLPISYLHIFPFSARKGTPAFYFKPKVDSRVIKERTLRMRKLDTIKRKAFIHANMNQPLEGIVQQKIDTKTGMLKAITSNYLTVFIDYEHGLQGKTIDLIIKRCHKDLTLKGKIIQY
ncbi:MAG: tRNA (N(6)-L-threonylcarbamoyladenosine(37)-C(2))-methylthiotransferase MtaB [Pseudomonadota bacterium]